MHTIRRSTNSLAVALLLALWIPYQVHGQEQKRKPALSAEIRTVLEKDGVASATKRFEALFPAEKGEYEVDKKGFAELAGQAMQNGDFAAGQAVMEMLSAIVEESMAEIEMPRIPVPPTAPENPAGKADAEPQAREMSFGPPREDLARFTGLYGTPDDVEKGRVLFVAASCDGHLVSGPMWADTSPWWMRSEADNIFNFKFETASVRMEFRLGADGNATAMIHDLDYIHSPLPRSGPLPKEWSECLRPTWG